MANVTMPNGDVVAFPDDMPKTEIRALIEKKFPDAARQALHDTGKKPYQGAIEGLGTPDAPNLLQQAFVLAGAVQCGFCIPGIALRAHHLVAENPEPTREEIARIAAQLVEMLHGEATVLGQRQRLRTCRLRGHAVDHGCLLVAIETQGLLL